MGIHTALVASMRTYRSFVRLQSLLRRWRDGNVVTWLVLIRPQRPISCLRLRASLARIRDAPWPVRERLANNISLPNRKSTSRWRVNSTSTSTNSTISNPNFQCM